jgi:hypothetical protein
MLSCNCTTKHCIGLLLSLRLLLLPFAVQV